MIRSIFVKQIDWNGITVEVSYEPAWLGSGGPDGGMAHLQVRCLQPERAALPITETGYRSHFVADADVVDQGGPVAYVQSWLDDAATSKAWKNKQDAARQYVLL